MTKARTNADNVTADIAGITAGIGITGGGTSGTVTITNDMATTIAAAGDLIYGTANDAYTRLAIGSTSNVLTVAGGVPSWAAPASGALTLISATSFSASSAHNVNDVFSTTYDNYLIKISTTAYSTNSYLAMRMRVSGSDNSSNNYGWSKMANGSNNNAFDGNYSNGLISSWYLLNADGANHVNGYVEVLVHSPYLTARTGMNDRVVANAGTSHTGSYQHHGGGMLSVNTSYTGFTLISTAGDITGNVKVYGYAN